jgi:mannose-6-phosphate isomerase-like protein (cupin superfamily)
MLLEGRAHNFFEQIGKMTYPAYAYRDFMSDQFPFKIEVRSLSNYNRVVHAHEHLQLCYVSSGSCLHSIQDKQAVIVKGDFFSVPPFLEHQTMPWEQMEFEMIQERISPLSERRQGASAPNPILIAKTPFEPPPPMIEHRAAPIARYSVACRFYQNSSVCPLNLASASTKK